DERERRLPDLRRAGRRLPVAGLLRTGQCRAAQNARAQSYRGRSRHRPPADCDFRSRISARRAQEQVRTGLSAAKRRTHLLSRGEEVKGIGFSRFTLLWKIVLSTSVAVTALFALVGWIVQSNVVSTTTRSLEDEVQASFQAYQSLWNARSD